MPTASPLRFMKVIGLASTTCCPAMTPRACKALSFALVRETPACLARLSRTWKPTCQRMLGYRSHDCGLMLNICNSVEATAWRIKPARAVPRILHYDGCHCSVHQGCLSLPQARGNRCQLGLLVLPAWIECLNRLLQLWYVLTRCACSC